VGTTLMAKKPKANADGSDRPSIAVTLRGSQEWKAWIEAGAKFCRTDVAKLIDSAVVDYLKARGFDQPAPDR
jgi:hypothetical protein